MWIYSILRFISDIDETQLCFMITLDDTVNFMMKQLFSCLKSDQILSHCNYNAKCLISKKCSLFHRLCSDTFLCHYYQVSSQNHQYLEISSLYFY